MNPFRQYWKLVFLAALVASALGRQAKAAEGALLELVPIDVSHKCAVNILRGTGENRNVAYVLPRIVVAKTEDGYPMIEFYPKSKETGLHSLYLGVEFPSINEEVPSLRGNEHVMIRGCDVDTIRSLLNESDARQKDPRLKGIDKIVPVQVRWIEAEIPSIRAKAQLGDSDVRLLDTQTKDLSLIFDLTDGQKSDVTKALRSKMGGLVIRLKVHFEAQEEKGKFTVKLDVDQLVQDMGAEIKGKFKANVALAGELLAYLKTKRSSIEAEVVVEGQVDPALITNVIDKTLDQMAAQYNAKDYQKIDPSKNRNYYNDGRGSYYGGGGERGSGSYYGGDNRFGNDDGYRTPRAPGRVEDEFPIGPGSSGANDGGGKQNEGASADNNPGSAVGSVLQLGPEVDVDTFLRRFSNKLNSRFSMVVIGGKEAFAYGTELQLRYSFADPFNRISTLKSGMAPTVVAEPVLKGETLQFRLIQLIRKKVQYETQKHYYDAAELRQEGEHLSQDFPFLMNVNLLNVFDINRLAGKIGVAAKRTGFFSYDRRVYGEEVQVIKGVTEEKTMAYNAGASEHFGIALGFSRKPLLVPLNELRSNTEWYEVSVDSREGIVTILANQDLGLPFMVNTDRMQAKEDFEVRHFEQVLGNGNTFGPILYKECQVPKKLPVQWTMVYVGVDTKEDDGGFSLKSIFPRQVPVEVGPPKEKSSSIVTPQSNRIP